MQPPQPDLGRLAADPGAAFEALRGSLAEAEEGELEALLSSLSKLFLEGVLERHIVRLLSLLHDRRYPCPVKRSRRITLIREALYRLLRARQEAPSASFITTSYGLPVPPCEPGLERTLCIDASEYPSEGPNSLAAEVVRAYQRGWRHILLFDVRGQRFLCSGLGRGSHGLTVDIFGSPGDYLASGLWGATVISHDSAQDQVANIMKDGLLVVYGDAGQALLYAAKGGTTYVMGNVAGRPYIFTVGSPRLVINGTGLDYLGEQCMAGDALNGGGFAIVNGIAVREDGTLAELDEPYPGSNLFSLASGGAVYIRDPYRTITEDQLNEGLITGLTKADCELILPYLKKNEELFGIPVEGLLTVKGARRRPDEVYIKVAPNPRSEKLKAARH
jgi:glutamate synthase domain-containing protein 3